VFVNHLKCNDRNVTLELWGDTCHAEIQPIADCEAKL
jgi:hypothetical protein